MRQLFFLLLLGCLAVPAHAFDMTACKNPGQSLNWDGATSGWICQQRSVVQKQIATTDAQGEITFTFPIAYSSTPAVTALPVSASGQPYVLSIKTVSTTAVTIRVQQAQTLPQNLVTLLAGGIFNVFGGTSISGVTVHIFASGN